MNIEFVPSFWTYAVRLAATSVIVYLIGCYFHCRSRINEQPDACFYFKILTGSIVVVGAFATLRSGGSSVLGGIWILILCYYLMGRCHSRPQNLLDPIKEIRRERITGLYFMGCSFCALAFFYMQMAAGFGQTPIALYKDFSFYGAIADRLWATGIENTSQELNLVYCQSAPSFYHYFELWFAGLLGGVFHAPAAVSLFLVVHPLLIGATCCGAQSVARRYGIRPVASHLLAPVVLLATCYLVPGYGSSFRPVITMIGAKVTIVLAMLIWYALAKENDSLIARLMPLCLLCILYPPVLPVLTAAMILTLLVLGVVRQVNIREMCQPMALILLPLVWVCLFYWQPFSSESAHHTNLSASDFFKEAVGRDMFIQLPLRMLKKGMLLISILPFLTLLLNKRTRAQVIAHEWRGSIWIIIGVVAAGTTAVSLLQGYDYDVIQLYTCIWVPMTLSLSYVVMCAALVNSPVWRSALTAMLVVMAVALSNDVVRNAITGNGLSRRMQLASESADAARILGAGPPRVTYMMDSFGGDLSYLSASLNMPFPSIRMFRADYYPIFLSGSALPERQDFAGRKSVLNQRASFQFERYCRMRGLSPADNESILLFIADYNIQFMIVPTSSKWVETVKLPIIRRHAFPVSGWDILELPVGRPLEDAHRQTRSNGNVM